MVMELILIVDVFLLQYFAISTVTEATEVTKSTYLDAEQDD